MITDQSQETIYHLDQALETFERIVKDNKMDYIQTNRCIYEIIETLKEALEQPSFEITLIERTDQLEQLQIKKHLKLVH